MLVAQLDEILELDSE